MKPRRFWPIIRRIWITVGLGATAVFVSWSLIAYRASSEARAAARSDASVVVAHTIAGAGYPVILVELPWRGAFGGADSPELAHRIDSVLSAEKVSRRIVVGGHSRGAVVASRLAAETRPV